MKKLITTMVIITVALAFLVAGNTRAEAMNNESAAFLTAGLVLLGIPVMHAIARDAVYPERGHVHVPPPPRYIERTTIVYVEPRNEGIHRHSHRHRHHERDCRHGWDRHENGRGHEDSHRDSRRHNHED